MAAARARDIFIDHCPSPESQLFQPNWLSKRQHPGKREEAEEGVEETEEEEEAGAVGPHKRQHPGRREDEASWLDVTQHKRQHPGGHSPWLEYAVIKRQHPGRRLVDPKVQRSWEEEGEEGEGALVPEKRQHPGKRACGPQGVCGQTGLLLGLLDDLSRGQRAQEKWQHPAWRVAWTREPLEE
jgi:thyrotropin-releasing hormone